MTEARCPVGTECRLPVDIILKSSDGVLLGGHQANLGAYSEGFPPPSLITPSIGHPDPANFEETSETLALLLRFMHNLQLPDITELQVNKLFALADAAEKWRVPSAMVVCYTQIASSQTMRQKYPFKCLVYALKYGYPKVADVAAPYTIPDCYDTVAKHIGHDRAATHAWLRLRQSWLDVLDKVFTSSIQYEPYVIRCEPGRCFKNWPLYFNATLAEARAFKGPTDFLKWVVDQDFSLNPLFGKHENIINGSWEDGACFNMVLSECPPDDICYCYKTGLDPWADCVDGAAKAVPTFSSLYSQA